MELLFYSAHGSNSSQRVEWALKYKKIPYRLHADEKASAGPYGYVPSISVDGQIIAESMAILEFLEEVFPAPPLLPRDSLERALVREVCEYVNSTIHPAQNRTVMKFLRPELADVEKKTLRAIWIFNCLQKLKSRLFQDSDYAVGNEFSLADIFVAIIYKKGLAHGAERDDTYEKHWAKLTLIPGHEVVV
ncbi:MAG: glutathione S-transferase N-terminal domain-containing protein [Pseudomonadota bacterium]